MPWSVLLDVTIGVSFIYLLLSVIASSIQEFIAGIFAWRGTFLSKGIDVIFDNRATAGFRFVDLADWLRAHFTRNAGRTVAEQMRRDAAKRLQATGEQQSPADAVLQRVIDVQHHPLVRCAPTTLPSYVPSRNFSLALLEVLRDGSAMPVFSQAENTVAALPEGDLRTTLSAFLQDAGGDIDRFRAHIEQWFDDAMDRVSGAYKRFTQYTMLIIGLFMAIGLNVNGLHIVKTLWETPSLRAAVVAQATLAVPPARENGASMPAPSIDDIRTKLQQFEDGQFPVGWPDKLGTAPVDYIIGSVPGWTITALAISCGAPFWFALLQNFLNVRNAGVKPKRGDDPTPPVSRP